MDRGLAVLILIVSMNAFCYETVKYPHKSRMYVMNTEGRRGVYRKN